MLIEMLILGIKTLNYIILPKHLQVRNGLLEYIREIKGIVGKQLKY
jgi:hypothetical protein